MSLSELAVEEVEQLLENHGFYQHPGLGRVYLEKQHGGEGEGDDYYIVLRIEDGDTTRYFKKNGYHASHDGSYLDGSLDEVKPAKKTITVYE